MNRELPKTLPAFLWHFIRPLWPSFLLMSVSGLIWAANESIFPYFIKLIINTVHDFKGQPHQIYAALAVPLIGIAVMWLVMEISMRGQGILMLFTMPKFRAHIRESVFAYVRQHSQTYFSNHFAGSIANKVADLPRSSEMLMTILIFNFISIMIAFVVALVLMWQANHLFAFIMLGWFGAHVTISILTAPYCNRLNKEHSESVSTLSGKVVDALTNISNVRLFARTRYEHTYFRTFQTDEIKKGRRAMWGLEKIKIAQGVLSLAMIFGMLYTLIYTWTKGQVSLGDFSLITMLSFNMLGLVWFMSYQVSTFFREVGTSRAALSLITAQHEIVDAPDAKPIHITQGHIQFDHVKFYYRDNHVIFNDISLNISPGEKIGLVGYSGAGKTTFVSLILRLFNLIDGRILIDNQNIVNVTNESLREQIAMIPQDPSLFHRTLMENIRYGRPSAADDEVMRAAKLAHCEEFIAQLENGMETLVGERGIKLSAGQRQRVAIARAILKDAPILILDEATSALDSVTEKHIQESLSLLMKDRTTIVIAHRLSTLSEMDRILVFDKSNIIEDGRAEDLLKLNGHFAKLWQMQAEGFLPEQPA